MKTLLMIATILGLTSGAFAETPPQINPSQATALMGPCLSDFQKFCSGVQPGNGAIQHCISQNLSQFSPTCQSTISSFMSKYGPYLAAAKACAADAQKLCQGVPFGTGQLKNCLMQNSAQLTQECQTQLASASH